MSLKNYFCSRWNVSDHSRHLRTRGSRHSASVTNGCKEMSLVGIRSKAVKMTLSLNVQSLGVLWCGPIAYGVDLVLGHEVLDIANASSRVGHAV
jgi:hypothetical protein